MKRFSEEPRVDRNGNVYCGSLFCGTIHMVGWLHPRPWRLILPDGEVVELDAHDQNEVAEYAAYRRANQ